jgi:hypothetical protein
MDYNQVRPVSFDENAVVPSSENCELREEAIGKMELFMPRVVFEDKLMEVGDAVCAVWYEEFTDTCFVRKLGCKHIFHSNCVEEWIFNHLDTPRCPMCNKNPFNEGIGNPRLMMSSNEEVELHGNPDNTTNIEAVE